MNIYSEPLNISTIPNYIRAGSAKALRRQMLRNNRIQKGYVHYFNIQFVDGEWWAWFIVRVENELEMINEVIDGR